MLAGRSGVSTNRACIDWTERRHHLGGPLGAMLFSRLIELQWIAACPGKRAVRVTHLGIREFEQQLGIRFHADSRVNQMCLVVYFGEDGIRTRSIDI